MRFIFNEILCKKRDLWILTKKHYPPFILQVKK